MGIIGITNHKTIYVSCELYGLHKYFDPWSLLSGVREIGPVTVKRAQKGLEGVTI